MCVCVCVCVTDPGVVHPPCCFSVSGALLEEQGAANCIKGLGFHI